MRLPANTAPAGVSPAFWKLVTDEPIRDAVVLDVGTGSGRIALAVAPLCRFVVGVDREPDLVEEARRRAAAAGIANAEFLVADADVVDYGELMREPLGLAADPPGREPEPRLVTAHLFMSDPLVERAGRVLPAGGALAVVGFHVDQWRETGRPSRFAYDEDRMARVLATHGFAVEHLAVEREVQTFGSVEEALARAIGLQERWKSDGRWFRYIKFLEEGGRTLTVAHLIVKARRR